jgi:adenine-specific DNA-methyltransferase
MDEVLGAENCVSVITFKKTTTASGGLLATVNDFLIWYAKDKSRFRPNSLYLAKGLEPDAVYKYVQSADGTERTLSASEVASGRIPEGTRLFALDNLTSPRPAGEGDLKSFKFRGANYSVTKGTFKTDAKGMAALAEANRLGISGSTLRYKRFVEDFPVKPIDNVWTDTSTGSFTESKVYVVQTSTKVIERCMLMATNPGDLVLDPTCGSGTTAFVAEQWGRRWITIDTSRVPLALARQRLLTACFDYQELKNPEQGPAGGFVYKMKQNRKGEHVGGIVPHVTLKSIANGEPPDVEVLVDRPEVVPGITRVTGPFVFEATIPTAQGFDEASPETAQPDEGDDAFIDRMVGVLQASPMLHLPGNQTVTLAQVRRPARALWLSAEAVRGEEEPIAIVFGPAHGSVTRRLVEEAWGEAQLPGRGYRHLYVIGFAIEPDARQRIDDYYTKLGLPVTYVQATPDVLMGDLLKNMRSSQIFSVCGQPDVTLTPAEPPADGTANAQYWQVKLEGLDVFDPATDRVEPTPGREVPAWFLDTDYNGLVFRPRQAFFPLTGAWDNLKRSLRAEFDDSVWAHLAGDTSEPFIGGPNEQVAVKVIDHRGNELMVVKPLTAPKKAKR